MTVPELIERVLAQLESQFYCDLPRRDFARDYEYLVAAIGTYGWECRQRGWEFDVEFLYQEFCRLLQSFKRSGTEVTWMPVYLQNAIRQHIGEHAEELKTRSKRIERVAERVLDGVQVAKVVVMPTPVELLATVAHDVRHLRNQRLAARRQRKAEERRQKELI